MRRYGVAQCNIIETNLLLGMLLSRPDNGLSHVVPQYLGMALSASLERVMPVLRNQRVSRLLLNANIRSLQLRVISKAGLSCREMAGRIIGRSKVKDKPQVFLTYSNL